MCLIPPSARDRFFLVIPLAILLASPSICWSKDIAILISSSTAAYAKAEQSFRSGIGTEIELTTYQLEGKTLEGRLIAKQIRASSPDLVLAIGLKAALAAKIEIVDTPVVFCMVLYPDRYDLPTQNMYGISMNVPIPDQLISIRQLVPTLKRIGLLYEPSRSAKFVDSAHAYAEAAGISLITEPISDEKMVPRALRVLIPQVDLLWLTRDPKIINVDSTTFILETAIEHDLPIFGFSPGLVRHGALGSLAPNFHDIGQQASKIARALLSEPPKIPKRHLIPPDKARLAVNVQTAAVLGLTPSPATLELAEAVYGGRPHVLVQDDVNPVPSYSDGDDTSVLVR